MHHYPRLSLTLLIGLLLTMLAASLPAQQEPANFRCRLRTVGWDDVPGQLYLRTPKGVEPISIPANQLSTPYIYQGPPILAFYKTMPELVPGQPLPPPDAQISLPQNNRDYILLVLPSSQENAPGFQILG